MAVEGTVTIAIQPAVKMSAFCMLYGGSPSGQLFNHLDNDEDATQQLPTAPGEVSRVTLRADGMRKLDHELHGDGHEREGGCSHESENHVWSRNGPRRRHPVEDQGG